MKRVVLRMLTSPRVSLSRNWPRAGRYNVASRLSFGLWDSIPDQELLHAPPAAAFEQRANRKTGRTDVGRSAGEGQAA